MNNKYSSIWRMWFEKRTFNMNPVLHVEKRLHSHHSFKPSFSHRTACHSMTGMKKSREI
jgi:hypothetical protein